MLDLKKLKLIAVSHQRNGVAGESFYVVDFMDHNDGGTVKLRACVFPPQTELNALVAVTSENIEDHWRGDQYEPWLRMVIGKHESKRQRAQKAVRS